MAFTVNDATENNKQHLNLSMMAYQIVQSDMFTFGEDKLSGFLNRIFAHYCPMAEASVSRILNGLRGDLEKDLSAIAGDGKTKKQIVNRLMAQKESQLIRQTASYGNGMAFKFWLNKENLAYLTEPDSECGEEAYYARRGTYIKCVVEEYARLPYVRREMIYFLPFADTIRYGIREEKQLRAVTESGTVYSIYPYDILCDPLSTANYLVGYCRRYDSPESEKQPCSFRISALQSIKVEKSKSAFLKESDRKLLAREIASRGVQFMADSGEEIHVRLTEAGMRKYRRQAHLRPMALRREGDTFVFRCTTAQAEFYFFKFGKDAEILLPSALRDRFRSLYREAADAYGCFP